MNQLRNPVKKLDSKLPKQRIGWPKISNTARKILQRSAKITTAKFKYTREQVLGHDWLNNSPEITRLEKKLVLRGEG